MTNAERLLSRLGPEGEACSLIDALSRYRSSVPQGVDPEKDIWDLKALSKLATTKRQAVNFQAIINPDLREIAKIWALSKLADRGVGPAAIREISYCLPPLGQVLGARSIETLISQDFYDAEALIVEKWARGTAVRRSNTLVGFASWFALHTGKPITYKSRLQSNYLHGRGASEAEREEKNLPDEVISSLLAAQRLSGVSVRDRFYVSIIAIAVGTGFRVGELTSLPADCLIKEEGSLLVRSFAQKGGKLAPRVVPPELAEIVCDAVDFILSVTAEAREHAAQIEVDPPLDWSAISNSEDPAVLRYFIGRLAASWMADPKNRLIDAMHTYFIPREADPYWVPLADLLEQHEGNISAISRKIGIDRNSLNKLVLQLEASRKGEIYFGTKTATSRRAFDTDPRIISEQAIWKSVGQMLRNSRNSKVMASIIDEVRAAQIGQGEFKCPEPNQALEKEFRLSTVLLRDPSTDKPVLKMQDALLATFKRQFAGTQEEDRRLVSVISPQEIGHWLNGYKRDLGTGKPGDSALSRLGIVDPRTNSVPKFSMHDFRHWLSTAYENGGLTQEMIATLFNRRSPSSNFVYNQTSDKTRHQRLKRAISDGIMIGHVAQAYSALADEERDAAAAYLEVATKFYNPMPHGICRLNWSLEPCKHSLSCFSCAEDEKGEPVPCELLVVDAEDQFQIDEIERINKNAAEIKALLSEDGVTNSPQYSHFNAVEKSTKRFLKDAGKL